MRYVFNCHAPPSCQVSPAVLQGCGWSGGRSWATRWGWCRPPRCRRRHRRRPSSCRRRRRTLCWRSAVRSCPPTTSHPPWSSSGPSYHLEAALEQPRPHESRPGAVLEHLKPAPEQPRSPSDLLQHPEPQSSIAGMSGSVRAHACAPPFVGVHGSPCGWKCSCAAASSMRPPTCLRCPVLQSCTVSAASVSLAALAAGLRGTCKSNPKSIQADQVK